MDTRTLQFLVLFIYFFYMSAAFSPLDNYLVNCGSNTNVSVDNRQFVGDLTKLGSAYLTSGKSISLTNPNPSPNLSQIYGTARVFTSAASYRFSIKKVGTHLVRFHFSPFVAQSYNLGNANFSVLGNGFSLFSYFSPKMTVIKEFVLMIDKVEFDLMFLPNGVSGFGFVCAIEVFSAPNDYILENGARLISSNGVQEFKDLNSQVLETVHRINVGGLKLTPFNDTLWRTWVPDEEFLVIESSAKRVSSTHVPNYQDGLATPEIAPHNVYMTAQQMNKDNRAGLDQFNVTWDFPVKRGIVRHYVRLHFCDIVSIALNQLYFDVYINGLLAYKDLDLSTLTFHELASPLYIDFVVDSDDSGIVRISVGPSDLSSSLKKNAILNGVEIMRMVSYVGGLYSTSSKKKSVWILVASIIGGLVGICLVGLMVLMVLRRRTRKQKPKPAESMGWTPLRAFGGSSQSKQSIGTSVMSPGPNGYQSLKISFAELQMVTNNFDKSLLIGSGGFGMVYKAVLKDATKVAVKRGMPGSRQGLPEFQTEITVLSKIRHRHLVSLVGYCEEQSEMILVYEYMEKGPLKNHLYGSGLPPLSWKQRLEICIGAARGLHYLHTGSAQGIIHRDIKSTNILLDENYVAKVADFGLSRSGPCLEETHVSTGVKGSFGYLDPEYFRRQQLTDKSDVYSFGVVLFEVVCARPAVDPLLTREQVNLAEWAMEWHKKGKLADIIDPNLMGNVNSSSLAKIGETAEKCLADYGVDRPSMGDVLWNLEYALQLHETGRVREPLDNSVSVQDVAAPPAVVRLPSLNATSEGDTADAASDMTSGEVFSQLVTKEGR